MAYLYLVAKQHPRANSQGRVLTHVLIAEKALGKSLPPGSEVHHADGNKKNNSPSNLVVCPDRAYHKLLHARLRAWKACGNPNWRKCRYCKQYSALEALVKHPTQEQYYHRLCRRAKDREMYYTPQRRACDKAYRERRTYLQRIRRAKSKEQPA